MHILVRNTQKRQFSRQYFVNKIHICRDGFFNILNVSTKRINTALYKTRNLKVCDQRGTSGGHNKISEHQKNCLINHMNQYPRYKPHYCRERRVEQEYLQEGSTLPLMYDLYKADNAYAVGFSSYKKFFLEQFNLKAKPPKSILVTDVIHLKQKWTVF